MEKSELMVSSKERVALDLAVRIANVEDLHEDSSTYRKKMLDLYVECLKATKGGR